MNATRNIGEWYGLAGDWLVGALGAPSVVTADGWELRFLFFDFVVEESLELLGVAFVTAAVIAFARSHHGQRS